MIATKNLPATRVATSAPAVRSQLDPRWNHARELLAQGRQVALALATEIQRLRDLYLGQGRNDTLKRGTVQPSRSPHDAANGESEGFQAAVREQLGISDDTAYRWLKDAERFGQILEITAGQVTEIEGKPVTAEVKERAAEALAAIQEDPTVRPARAWAGLWGGTATKGKARAAIDHARNLSDAIAKLKTSLPHWKSLPLDERQVIQQQWSEVSHLVEGRLE